MTTTLSIDFKKVAVMLLGAIFALSLFVAPVQKAQAETSTDANAEIIELLLAQLVALQQQLLTLLQGSTTDSGQGTGDTTSRCNYFTKSLYMGASDATTGGEVSELQEYLTSTGDYTYGKTTGYFGPSTMAAVKKWQYRNNVVRYGTPESTGYGLVGSKTRAALNKRCSDYIPPTMPPESQPYIDITEPNDKDLFHKGNDINIQWRQGDLSTLSIALYQNNKWVYWIKKDMRSNGLPRDSYNWDIPSNIESIIEGGENLRIYITGRYAEGSGYADDKSGEFAIIFDDETEEVMGLSADDEQIISGDSITYTIVGDQSVIPYVELRTECDEDIVTVSAKGGHTCDEATIIEFPENGIYRWTEWYTATEDAAIRFEATGLDKDKVQHINAPFKYVEVYVSAVGSSKEITVTSPNGGEDWGIGAVNTITWTPYDYGPDINPATDVKAYLERKINGRYSTVGEIVEVGLASIHTVFEIISKNNYPEPGDYYVRVSNEKTGASDRSDSSFTLHPDISVEEFSIDGEPLPEPSGKEFLYSIIKSGPVIFTWHADNADSCTGKTHEIDSNGNITTFSSISSEWDGPKKSSGSQTVNITDPGTSYIRFDLDCSNEYGSWERVVHKVRVAEEEPLGECYVGGCSSTVCSDQKPGSYATTCEWKDEYACYQTATCERQSNGACGWTQTDELKQCLYESEDEEPTACSYDYNNDGFVNSGDVDVLVQVIDRFNPIPCPAGKGCDINGDGDTNVFDISVLSNIFLGVYDLSSDGILNEDDIESLMNSLNDGVCPSGKICDVNGVNGITIADVTALANIINASDSCPAVLGASTSKSNLANVISSVESLIDSLKSFISSR